MEKNLAEALAELGENDALTKATDKDGNILVQALDTLGNNNVLVKAAEQYVNGEFLDAAKSYGSAAQAEANPFKKAVYTYAGRLACWSAKMIEADYAPQERDAVIEAQQKMAMADCADDIALKSLRAQWLGIADSQLKRIDIYNNRSDWSPHDERSWPGFLGWIAASLISWQVRHDPRMENLDPNTKFDLMLAAADLRPKKKAYQAIVNMPGPGGHVARAAARRTLNKF